MFSLASHRITERARALGKSLQRLTLTAKLRGIGALVALAIGAGIIVVADAYNDVVESSRWAEHSYQVLLTIGTIQSRIIDLETGQRGYLLTGEEEYLRPYLDANVVLDKAFDTLLNSTIDNAKQQLSGAELRRLIGERRALIDRSILLRRAQRAQAAIEVVASGEGKRLDDLIRSVLLLMEREERRLLNERREIADANLATYRWISIYGGLLIVFCLTAIVVLVRDDLLMRARLRTALRNLDEERTIALTVVRRFIKDKDTVRVPPGGKFP